MPDKSSREPIGDLANSLISRLHSGNCAKHRATVHLHKNFQTLQETPTQNFQPTYLQELRRQVFAVLQVNFLHLHVDAECLRRKQDGSGGRTHLVVV